MVLAHAPYDATLARLYLGFGSVDGPEARTLESIERIPGSIDDARATFLAVGTAAAEVLPDADEEQKIAELSVRTVMNDGTFEANSRIANRISRNIERELDQYWKARKQPLPNTPAPSEAGADAESEN